MDDYLLLQTHIAFIATNHHNLFYCIKSSHIIFLDDYLLLQSYINFITTDHHKLLSRWSHNYFITDIIADIIADVIIGFITNTQCNNINVKYTPFLSPIEQRAKINSIIENIKKFAKHRFDHKRISKRNYSDIKALRPLRLKIITQNKKTVDSLYSFLF